MLTREQIPEPTCAPSVPNVFEPTRFLYRVHTELTEFVTPEKFGGYDPSKPPFKSFAFTQEQANELKKALEFYLDRA